MACDVAKKDQIWRFVLQSENTGTMSISDPLLDTKERAEERARAEFLQKSYAQRQSSFQTYRTDLRINDTIAIDGIPWLVKGLSAAVDEKKIVMTVEIHRYG